GGMTVGTSLPIDASLVPRALPRSAISLLRSGVRALHYRSIQGRAKAQVLRKLRFLIRSAMDIAQLRREVAQNRRYRTLPGRISGPGLKGRVRRKKARITGQIALTHSLRAIG